MSYGEAEMYLVVGLGVILGLIALRVAPASPEVVGLSHANRKADYGGLASAAAVGGAQDYAAHEAQSGRIYFGGARRKFLRRRKIRRIGVEAVRRASPFPPVPLSMENLIDDLRMVLDPTRPKRSAEDILKEPSPLLPAPRAPASRRRKGFQVNKSKMLRLLSSPVLLLVVGCSTHVASLRYKPPAKLVVRAKRIQPVTIGNFADSRGTDPYLLGAFRSGVGIDLKKILADRPVSELVRAAFVEALAARKITEATATSRVAIEGTIVKLDCSYLFNHEAHVHLQVNVLSLPARTVIFSKFYGTDNEEGGRGAGILGDTDHLTQFQQRTLNQTIDKVMIDPAFLAVLTKPPID